MNRHNPNFLTGLLAGFFMLVCLAGCTPAWQLSDNSGNDMPWWDKFFGPESPFYVDGVVATGDELFGGLDRFIVKQLDSRTAVLSDGSTAHDIIHPTWQAVFEACKKQCYACTQKINGKYFVHSFKRDHHGRLWEWESAVLRDRQRLVQQALYPPTHLAFPLSDNK